MATERRLATGTVENYMTDIKSFRDYIAEAEVSEVEQITARDVRSWLMANMESGVQDNTMKRKLSSIRTWFRFMRKNKWMDTDVMAKIKSPKCPKKLPIFFKESEVEKIYNADIFPEGYEGERDKLILRMLYETGMRRSELVGLTVGNIDFSGKSLKVLGKGNKERFIPVENELLYNIKNYLALKEKEWPGNGSLFVNSRGNGITVSNVYVIVNRYMQLLSDADRTSPHIFRHTFATHMLNEGANIDAIKELLGHANLNATEIYTHTTREHLKEAYKHAHPRASKKQ